MRPTVSRATYERLAGVRLPRGKREPNRWEQMLAEQLTEAGIEFETEYRFAVHRRWRLDFAIFPMTRDEGRWIGIDIDGGVHRIKDKFARDVERHNALAMSGAWLHLRVTPAMVRSKEALELIRRALS